MKKYKIFSKDLRIKFLLIGIIPLLIVSIFLVGKIYFIIEQTSEDVHAKILLDIDFYTDNLLKRVKEKSTYIKEHFKDVDLDIFLKANNDIDTIVVFNKETQQAIKIASNLEKSAKDKAIYLKKNPFSKYKDIQYPTYNTVHKSINNKKTTISYTVPTEKYIFVFDINIDSIISYINYLKKRVDYIITIIDKNGNYIYNTSNYPYFHDNFFTTEYYNKMVKVNKPLDYDEFYNEEQGIDNFLVYYKSNYTGWTLITIEDSDTLDDKVLAILPYIILLIPIVILIIIIVAKRFTKNIVQPLEVIIDKMEKLSNGSDIQKIDLPNVEYSLFNRMIHSFNTMQNKIFQREQEILSFNDSLKDKIAQEIEKNRRKDQQMLQQSRLAQMGEMISMIAHQWRQPLTAISSTSTALSLKAQLNKLDKDMVIELTSKISEYSQHLSSTIDDFREFFKATKEKKDTTFTQIIQSVLSIIEISLSNKDIKLIQNLNSTKVFYTYPNELKQVLLNLIKNAEDALIERNITNPLITIETYDNVLIISDNAGGIDESIMDKIFDPYFSTKTKKDGTGLGLYMSKTIIEEHCGGKLLVKNNKDGAVFTIEL